MREDLRLREATPDDREFLYNLHCASLKDSITQTWGWNEAWQRRYFDSHFDPKKRQIIQFEGKDIGAIGIVARDSDIFIDYIALYPGYQRQGIGSDLIKTIMQQGVASGKPIRLRVLRTNPAVALYKRLRFLVEEESETHVMLIQRLDSRITDTQPGV